MRKPSGSFRRLLSARCPPHFRSVLRRAQFIRSRVCRIDSAPFFSAVQPRNVAIVVVFVDNNRSAARSEPFIDDDNKPRLPARLIQTPAASVALSADNSGRVPDRLRSGICRNPLSCFVVQIIVTIRDCSDQFLLSGAFLARLI